MALSDTPTVPPARIRFVRVMQPGPYVILAYVALSLVPLGAVLHWLRPPPPGSGPNAPFPVGFTIGLGVWAVFLFVGLILVMFAYQRRFMRRTQPRHEHLTRIAARPGAAARCPQVDVELAYRRFIQRGGRFPEDVPRRELHEILKRCGPGWAVVVGRDKAPFVPVPVADAVPFEPIALTEPNEPLRALLRRSYLECDLSAALRETGGRTARLRIAGWLRKWQSGSTPGATFRRTAVLVAAALVLCLPFLAINQPGARSVLLLLIGMVVLAVLPRLVTGRTWWLVPGGVAYRDHRLWRKGVKVGLVTRQHASMVLDMAGTAYFPGGKRPLRCWWSREPQARSVCIAAALLAAWVSTARTPTREEVLAFMGPDAEWAE
jgi:hypothetical protein